MVAEGCAPNLVTYNTLLEALAKRAKWREALTVLEALRAQGLAAEARTYAIVMAACNAAGRPQQALAVFAALRAAGRAPTAAGFGAAVAAHCRLGALDAAWAALEEMGARGCERPPGAFMAVLQAAEGAARWRVALAALGAMARAGLKPTPQAYAAAVGACAAAGELGAARALAAELLQQQAAGSLGGGAGGSGGTLASGAASTASGGAPSPVPAASPTASAASGGSGGARGAAGGAAGAAAPAHLLVAVHGKCCSWRAALAAFDDLAASSARPDGLTFGALAAALWASGSAAGGLLAARAFEHACRVGAFKLTIRSAPGDAARVVFVLPAIGPGMAAVALWRLLQELSERVASDGAGFLRESALLLIGNEPGDAPNKDMLEAARAVRFVLGWVWGRGARRGGGKGGRGRVGSILDLL